jgi:hypothetical protein
MSLLRGTTWLWLLGAAFAQVDDANPAQRAALLDEMRALAERTKVRLVAADQPADFVATPVFRYDDQPRKFIDATMWVWTHEGRPIAFQKIEAMAHYKTDAPLWGYCFTSLADAPLAVEWNDARSFRTTEAGTESRPLPEAPLPAAKAVERKRQMRDIARGFSARIIEAASKRSEAMRLLPTPIFEFADAETKLPRGAVFGFSSNGTNPDLLVVLEAIERQGKAAWHFAPARMTNGGIQLAYREVRLTEMDVVSSPTGQFATWAFFNTPRPAPLTDR